MTAHGVVLAVAAALAALYGGWWAAERNDDGPLFGWVLGFLVLTGCLLLDAGV